MSPAQRYVDDDLCLQIFGEHGQVDFSLVIGVFQVFHCYTFYDLDERGDLFLEKGLAERLAFLVVIGFFCRLEDDGGAGEEAEGVAGGGRFGVVFVGVGVDLLEDFGVGDDDAEVHEPVLPNQRWHLLPRKHRREHFAIRQCCLSIPKDHGDHRLKIVEEGVERTSGEDDTSCSIFSMFETYLDKLEYDVCQEKECYTS